MILAEKDNYPVNMMCRVLGLARSGFYEWLKAGACLDPYKELKDTIYALWEGSDRRFGARTIHSLIDDETVTLYRVRKCMKELKIKGMTPRAKKKTTIQDPQAKQRTDLIRRDFTSPVATYKLVGDITYLKTQEGWLYLSVVIDLYSRMVVGWAFSRSLATPLVISSLDMAKGRGYIAKGGIFHSDKGCQYTSQALALWAKENDVRLSCGRTGSCHDNAVAESFFATLKNEMYYLNNFATRAEAKQAVIGYIEGYYNRCRPHSTLDYQIPAVVMNDFMNRCDKAFLEEEEGLLAA